MRTAGLWIVPRRRLPIKAINTLVVLVKSDILVLCLGCMGVKEIFNLAWWMQVFPTLVSLWWSRLSDPWHTELWLTALTKRGKHAWRAITGSGLQGSILLSGHYYCRHLYKSELTWHARHSWVIVVISSTLITLPNLKPRFSPGCACWWMDVCIQQSTEAEVHQSNLHPWLSKICIGTTPLCITIWHHALASSIFVKFVDGHLVCFDN